MMQLVNLAADSSQKTSVEFAISIRTSPYLADHGFQGMTVLPGSFYIETALRIDREASGYVSGVVRNASFHNPVILLAEGTALKVDVRVCGEGRVEYTFYETSGEINGAARAVQPYAAKLEIDRNPLTPVASGVEEVSIQTFQTQAHSTMDQERFYGKLRENGNEYGPSFQKVSSIWWTGDQSLGKISVARRHRESASHVVHPGVLDAITQVMAPFVEGRGKTFALRSIERLEVIDVNFPDTLWAHATLRPRRDHDGNTFVGDVRAFDQSGKPYLACYGVSISLLESLDAPGERPAVTLTIASNFTVEPLEDSLNFWADYFGFPVRLEFTPYNQVFQQLLDGGGAFSKNGDGVNIILLNLQEWVAQQQPTVTRLTTAKAEQSFKDFERFDLPNGLEIVHLNQHETEYLYREIFEDECYLRHGIRLQDGDTVVDIGANIGLFSLFVMSRCKDPKIYAFEPAPVVYEILKANNEAYGGNIRTVNAGVSDRAKTASLTFYERSSVFSGFHADDVADREAIRAVVRNALTNQTAIEGEALEEHVNDLVADRLHGQRHECRLTSVSDIIRDHKLSKIDLLKIDAEKSELEIINGIAEHDWPKIAQIVVEIHDFTGEAVRSIENLLTAKGFHCAGAQECLLKGTGLVNLYATRTKVEQKVSPVSNLKLNIRDFSTALRSFMSHATAPLTLCVCPPNPEASTELKAALHEAEQSLLTEAGGIPNVHVIGSASLLQLYPVKDYYDPDSRLLGHIPYTSEGYAAIGTALSRTVFNLHRKPYKVIVLDCDNTLWKGLCGEDGPLGVEVSPPYQTLQSFMIDQMNRGMLLCLCSKNSEQDVMDVLAQRTDMVLKREHLVSWRINWKSKSENIKSLAAELGLGLDSFIFIDDNPLDCTDVRIECPSVLTLQMPQDSASIPHFLNHVWAFDHMRATEEDRNRTRMYRENAERHGFQDQTLSLKEFIEGLQLRVEISDATAGELDRVAQLTVRTNQFNFTSIRRSEHEVKEYLEHQGAACLIVRVADRFGDYGLVGAVLYEADADRLIVDTLLLSCRVLGRGVEYSVLSHLGQRAVREDKKFVELTCVPTERNLPARELLQRIGGQFGPKAGTSWTFPAGYLAGLEYEPDEESNHTYSATPTPEAPASPQQPVSRFHSSDLSGSFQRVAEELSDIGRLTRAIDEYRLGKHPRPAEADLAGANALQIAVINIWKNVLGRTGIGLDDNFFEAGGTSLRAVQLIAMIKKELKQNLSIVSIFECPTARLLAAQVSAASEGRSGGADNARANLLGQKRRANAIRRRVN
jgi:FkbH-like protein/FkbM family methyltransferase